MSMGQYGNMVNQPGYDQGPNEVVVQPAMARFTTDDGVPEWSWCHLATSVFSIFCCSIFGIIATIMSVLSYTDHGLRNKERYAGKKSCALGFAIAAIVIGSVTIVIAIIVVATTIGAAESIVSQSMNQGNMDLNKLNQQANDFANSFNG